MSYTPFKDIYLFEVCKVVTATFTSYMQSMSYGLAAV